MLETTVPTIHDAVYKAIVLCIPGSMFMLPKFPFQSHISRCTPICLCYRSFHFRAT